MTPRFAPLLLFLSFATACHHNSPPPKRADRLPSIHLSPDRKSFITSAGEPFHPWGFNYDRDHRMRLIEEYWHAEWDTVASDFAEMKQLGANVVRIHLSVAHFLTSPDTPNRANLAQLQRLLKHCESLGLYLDITGLGCYRKTDTPAWYDALDERGRWAAQRTFWRYVADTCKDSPAVFFYDICNEPLVPGSPLPKGEWMTGHLGDFHYCQAITLDPAGRDRATIARDWLASIASTIRAADPNHLISCGLLPNSLPTDKDSSGFDPNVVAEPLDFLCVHLYPTRGKLADDVDRLKAFAAAGKPVIVEEVFPLGCSAKELGEFMDLAHPHVAGWIGFYWGQTPEELAPPKTITDSLTLDWLKLFRERTARMR